MSDRNYLDRCLQLAKSNIEAGEIPVAAMIVCDNTVVAESANSSIADCDPTAHAEINAIRIAGKYLKNYRLPHATLYTSLEPCIMCLGAIIEARIRRVVFSSLDKKSGMAWSNLSILGQVNQKNIIVDYLHLPETDSLLSDYFKLRRSN